MGGNLFKCRRYNTDELIEATKEIGDILDTYNVHWSTIPFLSGKLDHGDLDLLVDRSTVSDEFLEYMANHFDFKINGKATTLKSTKNTDVFSFLWDELQTDLIFIDRDSFDFAVNYHAFNDLGGIIGASIRPMGFRLGREGLYYTKEIYPSTGNKNIYLTKDFFEFLKVFELDPSIYTGEATLNDVRDMVDYLKGWKYFSVTYTNPEHMGSARKNRARKRSVFREVCEYATDEGLTDNYTPTDDLFEMLSTQFDARYVEEQLRVAEDKAVETLKKKYQFSAERMKNVLGYLPENTSKIFEMFSSAYPSPREAAANMSDDEFKDALISIMRTMEQ